MRAGGRVTNFECIDVKDLRITAASLRLRRIVIGLSIAYILVFTPILGYFIWNYMMAQPQLRTADNGDSGKACINRRIPMHFAFHRGQHGNNGTAPLLVHHGGNHSAGWPPTEKRLGLVANLLGSRQVNSAGAENQDGSGSHAVPARDSFQQAAVAAAETSAKKTPESVPIRKDDSLSHDRASASPGTIAKNASTWESHVTSQQRWPELGEQLEDAGQVPKDANQRDHPIDSLPVQMAHQEMAPGDGLLEIGGDGPVPAERPGANVEPLLSKINHRGGTRKERKPHLDGVREESLPWSMANQSLDKGNLGPRDKAVANDNAGVSGAFERDQKRRNENRKKGHKKEQSAIEVEEVGAAAPLQQYNRRNLTSKKQMYALSEVDNGEEASVREGADKVFSSSSQARISKPGDGKSAKAVGLLSSGVSENKSDLELRRRRSERLKFKLKTYRRISKVASDTMTKTAVGKERRDASNIMRQLNIGLQKELPWKTSGQEAHQRSRLPSDGLRTHREQNGSAASSTDNTGEQRMIRGMPRGGKDDKEVLSFAEFFKRHLSSKQAPSKVREGIRAVHGRRLMIDYLTKQKAKQGLTEGTVAGGWPERPKEPAPTKYTLDPFHPYISKRGPGWDFYDPLKPPTERNNARELAEQEFYSPEQPSGEVQDAPTVAPVLPSNRSSLHGALGTRRQEKVGHLNEQSPGDADGNVREIFDAPNSDVRHVYKPRVEKKGVNSALNKGQPLSDHHGVPVFSSEHELHGEHIRRYNEKTIAVRSKRGEEIYVPLAASSEGGSVNHLAKARVGTGNDAFHGGHPAAPKHAATRVVLSTERGNRGGTRIETVSREPIGHDDDSLGKGMKEALPEETVFKTELRSAGIRVSEKNVAAIEGDDSRLASPRSRNSEPVPIWRLSNNGPNDSITTNNADDTALEIYENGYDDIAPFEDSNVIWSGPRDGYDQPANDYRGDVSHLGHAVRGPHGTSQTTGKYDAAVVKLTPPNTSVVGPLEAAVTRNDSGGSSAEALPPGGTATGLIGNEIEKDFEDTLIKNAAIEIDAVTAKKREPPSEPPGVDVLVENRVGTTGTSGSVFVPGDEKPRPGVPAIFYKRASSPETGSTRQGHKTKQSSKKENLNADVQSSGSMTARTHTASFLNRETRSTNGMSEEPSEPAMNMSDGLRRNVVNSSAGTGNGTTSRSISNDLKSVEEASTHPALSTSAGMLTDVRNMSVEGTTNQMTPSASHDVPSATSSAIHITIEVVRKRGDSKNNLHNFRRKRRKRRPVSSTKSSSTIVVEASTHQRGSKERLKKEIPLTASAASSLKPEAESQGTLRTVPSVKPVVEVADHSSPRGDSRDLGKNDITPTTSMGGSHKSKVESQVTLSTSHSIKPATDAANHSVSSTQVTEPSVGVTSKGVSENIPEKEISPTQTSYNHSVSSTQVTESSVRVTNEGVSEKIPEKERPPRQTSSNASDVFTVPATDDENSSMNETARNFMHHPTEPSGDETAAHSNGRALIERDEVAQNSTTAAPPTKAVAETSTHSQPDRDGSDEITHAEEEHATTGKYKTSPTEAEPTQVSISHKNDVPEAGSNLASLDNASETSKAAVPTTALRENTDDRTGPQKFETTDERATMLRLTDEALPTLTGSSVKVPSFRTVPTTDTALPTSNRTTKTSTPEVKTVASSSTNAPPLRTAPTTDTFSQTSTKTTETATSEMKSEDMMGVFDDDDKASWDLSGVKSTVRNQHSTEQAPVSTEIALNPRLIVVRRSTTPERKNTPQLPESLTPEEGVLKPRLVVVRRGYTTSQTEGGAPKHGGPWKNATSATAGTEPTALFPGEYEEYDDEEIAVRGMHFPMVKIRRLPSTTRRRLALMDLFGRAAPVARRTSLHPRLQHRIAVRRGHRTSPRSWPYHMTLFFDEPLNAVRVPVKSRG